MLYKLLFAKCSQVKSNDLILFILGIFMIKWYQVIKKCKMDDKILAGVVIRKAIGEIVYIKGKLLIKETND